MAWSAVWFKWARALLLLGRVSNLPTVWSNCVAGWWLGGGGEWERLAPLCLGATCLYLSGMFLNDAFDYDFDRQHRPERPIPSGAIRVQTVWAAGAALALAGFLFLAPLGTHTALLALGLIGAILVYDALHKMVTFSPLLMALCRLLLFVMAASTGAQGVTGLALWSALALSAYIVGLSYVARRESLRDALEAWPCALLAAPIFLAAIVNPGPYRWAAGIYALALAGWLAFALRDLFWSAPRQVGSAVSKMLAGIVWVDLLAAADASPWAAALFILLFLTALALQKYIPAT